MQTFTRKIAFTVVALAWASIALSPMDAEQPRTTDFTTPTGQTLSLSARPVLVYANGRAEANVSGAASLSTTHFRSVAFTGAPAETCMMGSDVRFEEQPRSEATPPFAWTIAARLVSWNGHEATLETRIERQDTTGAFRGADIQTPRRLILREGEHRVVDAVSVTGRDCEAVQFEVDLRVDEPEPVRNAALSYDIWLVHREADGSDRSARFHTSGLQGREVPYAFAALEHRTDGSAVRTGRGDVHTEIAGVIRGRARSDGRLDLTVAASRMVSAAQLGTGDGGTKRLTVDDGETVALELPPLISGSLPGVDLAQFLAGQSTAVRVTARRVR
jgi:hypothetical protein